MPSILKYVAQNAMDFYYGSYKNDAQFFTLQDFIDNTGNCIADMYQDYFDAKRKELKAEKKEEIVVFDMGMLSEQILEVQNKDNEIYALLKEPIMTFLTDTQNSGVQLVFNAADNSLIERTTVNSLYEFQYYPKTNRIFYYNFIGRLNFVNKGNCNVSKVKVLYIPQMHENAVIADTIADDAVQQTVLQMRQLLDKTVVKKSLDNNENMVLETEINKKSLMG